MKVTRAEMELQALWYLESLERIFGDECRGEVAPMIWIDVAMVLANLVNASPADREVPPDLVHGLVTGGLVEKTSNDWCRITAAGREVLARAI